MDEFEEDSKFDRSKIRSYWWSGVCYHKAQLDAIIEDENIKEYAYILHDKCGVKEHYHYLIHMIKMQRGSWFKNFTTEDMGTVKYKDVRSPQGAYDYLIHNTAKAKADGKYQYHESERIGTIKDFHETENIKENEHRELFNDIVLLIENRMTWSDFFKKQPKRIYSSSNIKKAVELMERSKYLIKLTPEQEQLGDLPW